MAAFGNLLSSLELLSAKPLSPRERSELAPLGYSWVGLFRSSCLDLPSLLLLLRLEGDRERLRPIAMRWFQWSVWLRARPFLAWSIAVAAFGAAVVLRFVSDHALPAGFPYLTFFPAVILTAFFGGLGPGILCAVLSGLAAWYWFIPPFAGFAVNTSVGIALGFYAFIVTVDIVLIHVTHQALENLQRERTVSRGLYDQQRAMFQELQHRVANNMQFVGSLLALQKRKVTDHPEAAAAFDEARSRLDTIARVHRRLYDPETVSLPIERYLQDLSDDVVNTSSGRAKVICQVEATGVKFELTQLTTLSLIVVEALTNALKHAFVDRDAGQINISLVPTPEGRFQLVIADDGVGFDQAVDLQSARSLGQRIMQSLASQLGGSIVYIRDKGTRMEMVFQPNVGQEHL